MDAIRMVLEDQKVPGEIVSEALLIALCKFGAVLPTLMRVVLADDLMKEGVPLAIARAFEAHWKQPQGANTCTVAFHTSFWSGWSTYSALVWSVYSALVGSVYYAVYSALKTV